MTVLDLESFDVAETKWVKSGLHSKLKKYDLRMDNLKIRFVPIPLVKMSHEPHG